MKKFQVSFLGVALLAFIFNISVALACPTVDCNNDCGNGNICSVTIYQNGVLCSWTICYGKGPSDER